MGMPVLELQTFLSQALVTPVVDVRSPAEFAQGHLPGAVSLPLFSDAERAEIGTLYKEQGSQPATLLGLAKVGPRLAELGARLLELAAPAGGKLLIHCWRGGMRSASMAWLAQQVGVQASTLRGGYKAFRGWAVAHAFEDHPLYVVAGLTGSGKTKVLHALAGRGEAVLDLEGLAHHKGSAFGALGELPQPTQEQFENSLALSWHRLPTGAVVWLEDESRTIGRCFLPETLWQRKRVAFYHILKFPEASRLEHLVEVYGVHPVELLRERVLSISKRLGGLRTQEAVEALEAGDLARTCQIVLGYYDKTYQRSMDELPPEQKAEHEFNTLDPAAVAEVLVKRD